MKSRNVAEAWRHNQPARANNMFTDGFDIFSYGLKVGYTNDQSQKVAFDYTTTGGAFRSMTTSKHVGYVKQYADKVIKPEKRR